MEVLLFHAQTRIRAYFSLVYLLVWFFRCILCGARSRKKTEKKREGGGGWMGREEKNFSICFDLFRFLCRSLGHILLAKYFLLLLLNVSIVGPTTWIMISLTSNLVHICKAYAKFKWFLFAIWPWKKLQTNINFPIGGKLCSKSIYRWKNGKSKYARKKT